jgi:hypothetical protein
LPDKLLILVVDRALVPLELRHLSQTVVRREETAGLQRVEVDEEVLQRSGQAHVGERVGDHLSLYLVLATAIRQKASKIEGQSQRFKQGVS